jgi:two-component system chemotaxis sensor kinase CheA
MMKTEDLDRQLLDLFTQEVKERSSELERNLLGIENAVGDDEKRNLQDRLLRIAHSLKGAAGLVEVRPVEAICHKMEDLLALLANEDRLLARPDLDLLLSATDAIAEAARMLERGTPASDSSMEGVLQRLDARTKRKPATRRQGAKAPEPGSAWKVVPTMRANDLDGSLQVPADRLDSLLYRSGELLASRARTRIRAEQAASLRERVRRMRLEVPSAAQEAAGIESGLRALAGALAEDRKLLHGSVTALDHEVRSARLQAFSESCQGLARIVRDMGAESGKSAELLVVGGAIEIDRSILAGLRDSLRHLVRNAIGHGIETPEERRSAGKPETGSIIVSAAHFGDFLQVRVEDDGRGLDVETIRKASDEIGLPEPQDERQQLRQVFEPGVSTSTMVTKLSGRGIGLEIVRNAVERMRGTVEVAQVSGGGAAFTLTLPVTLATVRALEVVAGGQVFVIDTASIRRVVRITAKDLPAPGKPNVLTTGNGPVHIIDLAGWLGLSATNRLRPTDAFPAVIVGPMGSETAVLVEEIAREQELLARSLGRRLAAIRHYNGGTVLPDGRIALLLNAAALVEAATQKNAGTEAFACGPPPAVRKVLVVDDSPSVRTLVKLILEAEGYKVAVAGDGLEAWEHLQAHGADMVIADVDMPAMDGFMLTRTIRESERFPKLPVILVTGRETQDDKAQGLQVGANAYIAKNGFDQRQFLETVRQVT